LPTPGRAHGLLRFLTGLAFAGTALTEWAFLNGRPDVAAQTLAQWSEHAERPGAGPVTAEVLRYCARSWRSGRRSRGSR